MDAGRITGSALQDEVLQGQPMKTLDDVAAMRWLKSLGWGTKRIARELGCSHHTVRGTWRRAALTRSSRRSARSCSTGTRTGCASGSSGIAAHIHLPPEVEPQARPSGTS
jgi:Homeodomain-like domain